MRLENQRREPSAPARGFAAPGRPGLAAVLSARWTAVAIPGVTAGGGLRARKARPRFRPCLVGPGTVEPGRWPRLCVPYRPRPIDIAAPFTELAPLVGRGYTMQVHLCPESFDYPHRQVMRWAPPKGQD